MEHLQTDKIKLSPEMERSLRPWCEKVLPKIYEFFKDPQNRADFERWKAEREAGQA
jgi:hypothetical protein